MKKIAVLCKDGFEEIEALTPVDVLRRANVHVDLVGMDDLKVTSSHQITIQMDCVFNDQIKEYDGVVIPGGLPGATNLRDDARVIEIVQQFNQEHKLIAAICAGPIEKRSRKIRRLSGIVLFKNSFPLIYAAGCSAACSADCSAAGWGSAVTVMVRLMLPQE